MRKIGLIVILMLLIPAVCLADGYVLLMSRNDKICRPVLNLYNADVKIYGRIRFEKHADFNFAKWEEEVINLRPPGTPVECEACIRSIDAKIALFDINNDSIDEVIIKYEGSMSNSPTDEYDVFRYDDREMLADVVDGKVYNDRTLINISSQDNFKIALQEIDKGKVKNFPKRMRSIIETAILRGETSIYLTEKGNKIHFLKHDKKIYIIFDEYSNAEILAKALDRYHREGSVSGKDTRRFNKWLKEGFRSSEKYSIIGEYRKDNTLAPICLFFEKDKPAKAKMKK